MAVVRAGATDTASEPIGAGEKVTLNDGDYTTLPQHASGDIRHVGKDPAQVAVAELIPEELAASLVSTPVS